LSRGLSVESVGLLHVVVLGAAVTTLLALPCAVGALLRADEFARRRAWSHRPAEETQALRELDRALPAIECPLLDDAPVLTIDEIVRELRRLGPTPFS
jgi:hypothetical protein